MEGFRIRVSNPFISCADVVKLLPKVKPPTTFTAYFEMEETRRRLSLVFFTFRLQPRILLLGDYKAPRFHKSRSQPHHRHITRGVGRTTLSSLVTGLPVSYKSRSMSGLNWSILRLSVTNIARMPTSDWKSSIPQMAA